MPERIDQTIQLNEKQILKRVLNENDTLAVTDVNTDRPGHYLFSYSTETQDIDGVQTTLQVTTIREFEDSKHIRLRKTVTVRRRGNQIRSLDITEPDGAAGETRQFI